MKVSWLWWYLMYAWLFLFQVTSDMIVGHFTLANILAAQVSNLYSTLTQINTYSPPNKNKYLSVNPDPHLHIYQGCHDPWNCGKVMESGEKIYGLWEVLEFGPPSLKIRESYGIRGKNLRAWEVLGFGPWSLKIRESDGIGGTKLRALRSPWIRAIVLENPGMGKKVLSLFFKKKQDALGVYTCASSWINVKTFDFIEFWLYTQDLASQF